MVERVLVLPRSAVPGGCDFLGLRLADADGLADLRRAVATDGRYLDRPLAEDDPTHKQLIPYVVVRDGAHVFLMRRTDAGGDARLHGKASIGVGGHLNPVDDGEDALDAGLRREWAEELRPTGNQPFASSASSTMTRTRSARSISASSSRSKRMANRSPSASTRQLAGSFVDPESVAEAWERLETWSQLAAVALGLVEPSPAEVAYS